VSKLDEIIAMLNRFTLLREKLSEVEPTADADFFKAVREFEKEEPQWTDRDWVVRQNAHAFMIGLEKKGLREYRREVYRGRIESMVARLKHPFLVALVLVQILENATTGAQAVAMLDEALAAAVPDQ
jgi:hypothetical protein